MQDNDTRKAGDYEIINSIYIGDKELVLGVDMNNADGLFYLVADCKRNEILERYDNALIGDDFLEIAEVYSNRLKEQIDKAKTEQKDMPKGIITADMCDTISDRNLKDEIIVIKADVLRPEYRSQMHQIVRCVGGNGANHTARGSAVFCDYFYNEKHTRFERYDVLGILKKEHYPEWLTKRLEFEKAVKGNTVFEYGGYHFLPVGVVHATLSFEYISKHIATDKSLGLWGNAYVEHYGKNKVDYKHKEFYKACNKIPCDIFKCLENGKEYLPADHELFEYIGKYEVYKENTHTKQKHNKDKER